MCPDIVETKLKFERERKWNPDPQMINKWTVLFNLQKDYLSRIKPALDGMKNYNGVFNEKIKKQKLEKENLENLIQFQNKINADLSSRDLIKNTKFDSDEKTCDDEELKYKSNKIVAAVEPQLNVSKANIANKSNNNNMPLIKEFNKKLLGSLKGKSNRSFSFIETPESVYSEITAKIDSKVKPQSNSLSQKLKLDNEISMNYLLKKNKLDFLNKKEIKDESEKHKLVNVEKENEIINGNKLKEIKKSLNNKENNTKNQKKDYKPPVKNKNLPIVFSSFLETKDNINFDKNLFETLIQKTENYNLETQRRGRRRSRFPDPQWDCAETQIGKLVRYICEDEVSSSYQKYCKPIFEQINTMIESFLYHDNNIEICQNLHMCPV